MPGRIHRITLFKLPKEADQLKLLEAYKALEGRCRKRNGKPYIISLEVAMGSDDKRSQGFTVMSKGEFASREAINYYDNECEAHMELKETVKKLELRGGVSEGVLVIDYIHDPADDGNDVSKAT
ncbi:stress responsive A/B barrel domain-containing protein [Xylaria telfairii]|nr:stress responsive A/B barrel domain-containing protein [Xylaria telfairii]